MSASQMRLPVPGRWHAVPESVADDPTLTAADKELYLAVRRFRWMHPGQPPDLEVIAKLWGHRRTSIYRGLKRLIARSHVISAQHPKSRRYVVLRPAPVTDRDVREEARLRAAGPPHFESLGIRNGADFESAGIRNGGPFPIAVKTFEPERTLRSLAPGREPETPAVAAAWADDLGRKLARVGLPIADVPPEPEAPPPPLPAPTAPPPPKAPEPVPPPPWEGPDLTDEELAELKATAARGRLPVGGPGWNALLRIVAWNEELARRAAESPPPLPADPATPRLTSWDAPPPSGRNDSTPAPTAPPAAQGPSRVCPGVGTEDLIRFLVSPGATSAAVETAAARLAEVNDDARSLPYYRAVCREVRDKALLLTPVLKAFRASGKPGVKSRGAIFASEVSPHRPQNGPA